MVSSRRLSGTTWEVYLYILTSETQGVRDIWRGLNLSSPSLAQYHVNKLLELGLLETTPNGGFQPNEKAQRDALRNFIILRGKLVPRLVFYGALLLGVFFTYVLLWPFRWDFRDFVVLAMALFSITTFFYEAYRQHQSLLDSKVKRKEQ
jgi:hypothetical protein